MSDLATAVASLFSALRTVPIWFLAVLGHLTKSLGFPFSKSTVVLPLPVTEQESLCEHRRMQTVQSDNMELLLNHLPADSLASKLVTAYKQASPEKIPAALEAILSGRFEEIRDAIEHAEDKSR